MNYKRTVLLATLLAIPFALVSVPTLVGAENSDQSAEVKEKSKGSATITRGMPKDEVLKLLGEPDNKKKMKASDGTYVDIWNYRRIAGQTTNYQVTGVEMVETWSPSLGEWIEVPEEIEELVQTTIFQTVEIVFHKDKVLTFKADLDQDIDVVGQ